MLKKTTSINENSELFTGSKNISEFSPSPTRSINSPLRGTSTQVSQLKNIVQLRNSQQMSINTSRLDSSRIETSRLDTSRIKNHNMGVTYSEIDSVLYTAGR